MNRLLLKALVLNLITKMKFGDYIDRRILHTKKEYCMKVGIAPSSKAETVLRHLRMTYEENGVLEDFDRVLTKFEITL